MKMFKALIALSFFFATSSVFAASISVVKNNRVMILLEGETASPGSEFFALNPQGKKVAIVRVTQVKGDRAVAEIVKGAAKPGYKLQSRGGATAAAPKAGRPTEDYYDKKLNQRNHTGNSYGIVGGYLMNSMSASFIPNVGANYKAQPTMSGSTFGVLGFYDYALSPSIVLRAMAGLEQFSVSGSISTPDCSFTTTCSVSITYLSMYGYGRWNFYQGNTYKFWAGGGVGYLYAMSKASTFLKPDQITANQIFVFSGGMDYKLSASTYIPVSLEYGLYPSSDSVKANIIFLRAGYAWNF